ncbi:MAG: 2'-deoxycytidine 5'-triphosphate deaminase [SAR324 cluster bacterium]|nr:2'-deoxycytidine 5'-triphosphate deaminase [SAR324 cluster bacterium]
MAGVLSSRQIQTLIQQGMIGSQTPFTSGQIQPNTLDLRLGAVCYRVRSSFLTRTARVEDKINELLMYELDLRQGAILEKGCVYIIPLQEMMNLPEHIHGRTNPKSSTGRLDIFTRVISDYDYRFNYVAPGYHGKLYVEVSPMSFTIEVHSGDSLNQLRLVNEHSLRLDENEIREYYKKFPLLYDDHGNAVPENNVDIGDDGLFLSIDLSQSLHSGIVGYRSKKNSEVIDIRKVNHYPVHAFWEPISLKNGHIILEPEEFYIFASRERIAIPEDICGEMIAYDPDSGELRVHYAGFFDSGFGFSSQGKIGAKAVLEIRPHDVPFLIEHGQVLCRILFETNDESPVQLYGSGIQSHYQHQGLRLSKHFMQD